MPIKFKRLLYLASNTILFSTLILSYAYAQSFKYNFKHINVEDGLQNNIVFAITQDQKGFMWFATMTGIDRYDGVQFEHYKIPNRYLKKSDFSMVQFISCDLEGNVWAASSNSLLLYDEKSNTFKALISFKKQINVRENITSLFVGNDGLIWLGLNNGVLLYQAKTGKFFKIKSDDLQVRAFLKQEAKVLWLGTKRGICKLVFDGQLKLSSKVEKSWNVFNKTSISSLSKDRNGRYWVGTLDKGLFVSDLTGHDFSKITVSNKLGRPFTIKDVLHDNITKTHLVALDGGGVVILSDRLKRNVHFQSNEDNPNSLNNNGVYDIFIDSYSRIWLATYGNGVNYYTTRAQPFTNFKHEINNPNSLSNNMAKCITEDDEGNLWFGTRKGLSKLNRKTSEWLHLNEETKGIAFTSDNVLSVIHDNGYLWAGTYGGGLMKISLKNHQITSYRKDQGNWESLGSDYVYALLKDKQGFIWAGGIRGPLSVFNPVTEKFLQYDLQVDNINCIMQDSEGNIRVGTEKGIFILKLSVDLKKKLTIQKLHFLSNVDKVYAILEDKKDGFFWLGTQGYGLVYTAADGTLRRKLTEEDGLSADVAYGMLQDIRGGIWVSTINGISHIQDGDNVIINYYQSDGLVGSQYNYGAFFSTKNNELIFGSTNGFTLFDPLKIRLLTNKPDLVFTNLHVNSKKIIVDTINGPLFKQIDDLEKLVLPNNQNSFSISFANLAPAISGKHLYSWKLEGFDNDWSSLTTFNDALYTNISSGNYKFLVRTFEKGQQSKNPVIRKLAIYIEVPWWASKTAYFIYFLLLSGLAYGIFQYYKIKIMREKYAVRLKLQTTIAHEIRTPLTLIKGPLKSLLNYKGLPAEYSNNLILANRNVDKLQNIITQFIDYQRTALDQVQMQVSTVNFSNFFDEIIASFKHLSDEKEIRFTYYNYAKGIELLIDRDKMEKVFNNLISNAVKYTPKNGTIDIQVKNELGKLIVVISDNGIGIPENQQQFIFRGFYRADNTINLRETGSGIGLSISKEMIALHKGKISLKSKVGQGTTFTVEIPVKNDEMMVFADSTAKSSLKCESSFDSIKVDRLDVHSKILIVEDNNDLRNYLINELERLGYTVKGAENGKTALEALHHQSFDLVVTDIMMPEINGFQLCAEIKKDIRTCHIPVIMLTTINDRDYLLEGYRSGADDYVQKPFDINYIYTRVDNLLQNRLRFKSRILSVFESHDEITKENPELIWLRDITKLIINHMNDSEFSVEKLCLMVAMSRSALFRKFKALTSDSPQQYINQLRLRKAVELLQNKRHNINEIAYSTGFSDTKYFSTAFKKHFGKSPRDYQKEL